MRIFSAFNTFIVGAFHSTILRKAEFRSHQARKDYFKKCDEAVARWRAAGPKPLNNGGWDVNGEPLEYQNANGLNSGLYLFTDRNNISHFFKPNFLPPYDTEEKRKIIDDYLKDEWNEKSLTFQPVKSIVDIALEELRAKKKNVKNDVHMDENEES